MSQESRESRERRENGGRVPDRGPNGDRHPNGDRRPAVRDSRGRDHTPAEEVVRRMITEERAGDARTRTADALDRTGTPDSGPESMARELRAQTTALDGLTAMMRDLKHDLRMVKVDLDKQRATLDQLLRLRDAGDRGSD